MNLCRFGGIYPKQELCCISRVKGTERCTSLEYLTAVQNRWSWQLLLIVVAVIKCFLQNYVQQITVFDLQHSIVLLALTKGSMDLSRPWVSLGKICRKGSVAGWITSTGPNGKVSVIPNDRLESLSRDLTWAHEQNSWPSIGFNPGL